ncbi:hypothetical protein MNEG_10780 [Monoraphidium neglectum]|uniref:Lipid-A-disaccharide synthase n=1 Tax=Monoraphidium neglectum TaxID=145388 RepID=A0A0D2JBV6_9CHLO|nr:hypothetical protein MNEG_10780 [Monoraphidium neglectum]KIY97182.1 hypothetical protein MNEG_10780 [Monoraphidium neglectum]|eukprot:XP_013896202.1 hypothetical protein MNEG_10780 [Monoraphidium neglectum]
MRARRQVPRVWRNEAAEAAEAFSGGAKPVAVVALGGEEAWDALAASTVALADVGEASIYPVLAGTPLVCAAALRPTRDALPFHRGRAAMGGRGCLPNFLLGREAVPELGVWAGFGRGRVVAALGRLLGSEQLRHEQKEALQSAAAALMPARAHGAAATPGAPRHRTGGGGGGGGGGHKGASASGAAAAVLLRLIQQRRQQVAAAAAAAAAKGGGR